MSASAFRMASSITMADSRNKRICLGFAAAAGKVRTSMCYSDAFPFDRGLLSALSALGLSDAPQMLVATNEDLAIGDRNWGENPSAKWILRAFFRFGTGFDAECLPRHGGYVKPVRGCNCRAPSLPHQSFLFPKVVASCQIKAGS